MKKLLFLSLIVLSNCLSSQNVCNSGGNLMIFTNYDGGTLNINVNQNIPNLVIGVCGYEATSINLTGAFVGNVVGVRYAGFNGTNNPCGGVLATSINGAPVGANTSTVFSPASTLANSNGNGSIICGYSCANNTSQGGCNTTDQIEAYFLNYFAGSSLYAHRVQYGCWSGTYSISAGGSCCPVVPFNPGTISSTQSVCPNATITPFTSVTAAVGGTGAISYQWQSSTTSPSTGFTNILGATSAVYSPPNINTTTFYRRAASTALNPVAYSNVLTVSVLPVEFFSILPNPSLCEGDFIGLSILGAFSATSYSWSGPANFTSTLASTGFTGQVSNSGNYSITVTFSNGCSVTSVAQILINARPVVTVTGAVVCTGQPATLTATGPTYMSWAGPTWFTASGPQACIQYAGWANAGIYTITAFPDNASNCFGTATVNLVVNPLPLMSFLVTQPRICKGANVTFTVSGASTYSWASTSISTSSVLTTTLVRDTVYVLKGTSSNGCVNTASLSIFVYSCVGFTNQKGGNDQLVLFPNPNTGNFTIGGESEIQLIIINELGQTIKNIFLEPENGYQVSVSGLANGIYFVVSPHGDLSFRQKIIVQN